jgi:hypothetical protein
MGMLGESLAIAAYLAAVAAALLGVPWAIGRLWPAGPDDPAEAGAWDEGDGGDDDQPGTK